MSNRKTMACGRCGRPVLVGVEAVACRCWACTGFHGDPPAGAGRTPDTARLADVKGCVNLAGQECIVRERRRCIVLDGKRCGWHEKAVRPAGEPNGRVCAECGGEVPKRRRYCDHCRQTRRRSTYRAAQTRKRVSCQQLSQKSAQILHATIGSEAE